MRLQDKPFQILLALLERPGEVVTREDLRNRLWPGDTFVDFEHSLNNAVNRLRETLHDSAEKSRFVETLPKLGYRFISPVEVDGYKLHRPKLAELSSGQAPDVLPAPRPRTHWLPFVAVPAAIALVAAVTWMITRPSAPDAPPIGVIGTAQVTRVGRVVGYVATDGKQVFTSLRTGGELRLAMVSVSGGEPLEIPTPFPNPVVYDISADGTELLVGSHHGMRDRNPVWIVQIGGDVRRLGDIAARDAAWSNDMERIVYTAGSDLLLSDADGRGLRTLASTNGSPVRPAWSPDDRAIRFTQEDATTGAHSIWEVASDGTGLRQVLPLRVDPNGRFADGASAGVVP
jgi:DNA-binding winged helix-turn-helix (wHTH) protein